MNGWSDQLRSELAQLEADGLRRQLHPAERHGRIIRRAGRDLVNLGGNDYLGFAEHPRLKDAAIAAIRDHGVGGTASRLVAGNLPLHEQLEARFAAFKHHEAALFCPCGYTANLAVVTTLAGKGDVIYVDKLAHASLLDAAQASGAVTRVFPHLNYERLDRLMERHTDANPAGGSPGPVRRRFIVTDSVFSMDGDVADLPRLCGLARRHDAALIVDEAHATGVLGPTGAGLAELQGVADRIDVTVSTAGKALGGLGGIITAGRQVIDSLVTQARPFIYTTAVPPAQVAAVSAALDLLVSDPQPRLRLAELSACVRDRLQELDLPTVATTTPTPIIPLITGSSEAALDLSRHLEAEGFYVPAIRPPTVARGSSRARLSLRADLTDEDIDRLCLAIGHWRGAGRREGG